jgi:hypothetical protein
MSTKIPFDGPSWDDSDLLLQRDDAHWELTQQTGRAAHDVQSKLPVIVPGTFIPALIRRPPGISVRRVCAPLET